MELRNLQQAGNETAKCQLGSENLLVLNVINIKFEVRNVMSEVDSFLTEYPYWSYAQQVYNKTIKWGKL